MMGVCINETVWDSLLRLDHLGWQFLYILPSHPPAITGRREEADGKKRSLGSNFVSQGKSSLS